MSAKLFVSVLVGCVVFFTIHIGYWRLKPSNSPRVLGLFGCGFFGFVASAMALAVSIEVTAMDFYLVWGIDLFIIMFYVLVYGVLVRSVSVTLLGRLLHEPGTCS